jgi:transcriptional regulator GlxA family with amidase domain
MSVCTGAFKLADAGLLDGKQATTHHDFWDGFATKFPKVQLQRGSRFVQSDETIYTAGGLTSGIDLALHVVEKLYGREAADRTAAYMEYRR